MFQIIVERDGELKEKDIKDSSIIDAIESIYNPEDEVVFKWGNVEFKASLK